MKRIKQLVDCIDEELEGAKDYAEMYLQLKADGNGMQSKFKDMAMDELRHAGYVHDYATEQINKLETVYTPPVEMAEEWERSHRKYVEKAAWVRQMLTM